MPPSRATVVSTTRAQSSARRQSARMGSTSAPVSARNLAAASDSPGSRRAVMATLAPSAASSRAMP